MSKKVLIICSSPRKGANTDTLSEDFARGAKKAGHEVEMVYLRDLKIHPCMACYYCASHTNECAQDDDIPTLLLKMEQADVIALASPIYFYNINAQLKMLIDRSLMRYRTFTNKEFYFLLSCADEKKSALDNALATLRGFTSCLDNAKERGFILATGLYKPWDVSSSNYREEAFTLGSNI